MSILFANVTAVTMDPANPVIKNAFVAVEGTKIASVGTGRPAGEFERVMDCAGKVMMPGLVNAHTHVPMALLRGYGGGRDLQHWLNDCIFPAEDRMDERCVAAGTALGLAEMIASGTTCIADMYMKLDVIARTILESGISANLSCGGMFFGDPADFSPEKCGDCANQTALTEGWHGAGDGQILADVSIHGEYTSCAPLWEWMADYGQRHGLGMHVHVSETKQEHEECMARREGLTPIQILDRYGVWQNGVASNNNHDMFEEIKLAAILHKGITGDPAAVSAFQALSMATVNGARSLGRDTGVISAGKLADLILLDFSHLNLFPCHDVLENLVFSARGSDVCMNMARGKIIYENGTFLTLDLEKIKAETEGYALPLVFGEK